VLEHGMETGIIKLLPTGEFIEVHQPLGPTDAHGHGTLSYSGTPVPKRMAQLGAVSPLRHVRGFFYPVKEKPEIQAALDELEAAPTASSEEPAGEQHRQLTD
jgi:ubiquinol-cytochrome c reductase cytochrome b subunit